MPESEHFKDSELRCPGCGLNNATPALLGALEAIRALLGVPVHINSACRCKKHNAAVGGARHSQHLVGKAADICAYGKTAEEVCRSAVMLPEIRGIGMPAGADWLHIDVRASKKLVRWRYNLQGRQIPWGVV